MGVEVVPDHHDGRCIGVVDVEQRLDLVGHVDRCLGLAHVDLAPAAQGLGEQEVGGGAQALILAVVALGSTRLRGQRLARLPDKLGRLFVQTDH